MSDFWHDWLHNIWVTLAIIVGVCIFFLVFMRIFYPDSISMTVQMLKWTAEFISMMNLWPIVGLAIIGSLLTSTLPRRRRRAGD